MLDGASLYADLDPRYVNVVGDTMTGALTIDLANATALSLGTTTKEGGDIVVYEDSLGRLSLLFDADADALTLGNVSTKIGSLTINQKGSGLAGSAAITITDGTSTIVFDPFQTATSLPTLLFTAGGFNSYIYASPPAVYISDPAVGGGVYVDESTGNVSLGGFVGVPAADGSTRLVVMDPVGTGATIFYVDGQSAPFSGSVTNYASRTVKYLTSANDASGFNTYGLSFAVQNQRALRNVPAGQIMTTFGIEGIVYDMGNAAVAFSEFPAGTSQPATRNIFGARVEGRIASSDQTRANNTVNNYGIYAFASDRSGESKTLGTLTVNNFGGDFYVDSSPTLGGARLVTNSYGVRGRVLGSITGVSLAIGVYGDASGADTNWSGYFINSGVGIGVDGSLANKIALQIGASNKEGGDIIVYQDLVGTVTFQVDADLPAVQLPFWSGDYGAAWGTLALPAAPNGSIHTVYNSNAGVLASRLYVRSNGVWTYVNLT